MIWVIDDHKSWSRSSTARVKTTASCRRRQLELLAHLPAIFLAKNYNFIGNILLIDRPTKLLKISQSCYGEHFISDNKAAKKCFKSRVFGNVKGVLSFEIWSVLLYREYFFFTVCSLLRICSGVPQGSILGPLLFLLYVNEIPDCIPCFSDMFADDTLLHNSAPVNEVSFPIQAGLLCMSNWCRQWLLKVYEAKCKCIRITRSKVNGQCSYSINSLPLEQVVTHKHLGVTFSSDLSWKHHVLTIAAKANKILGLT